MPSSNFPQGFSHGFRVRGIPILQAQPGIVFWLDNSQTLLPRQKYGSDSQHGTFLEPYATLNFAVAQCVPGRGDIIMIGAGHRETISTATAVSLAVSGVAVIGLGSGPFRPTFVLDTAATSTITIAGAGITFQNCLFLGNFLSIASCFTAATCSFTGVVAANVLTVTAPTGSLYVGATLTGTGVTQGTVVTAQISGTANGAGTYSVTGAATVASASMQSNATDFTLDNCEFRDLSSTLGFLSLYTPTSTANGSDGFQFLNSTWYSLSTVSPTVAFATTVAQDRWTIADSTMYSPTTAVTEGPIILSTGSASLTNFTLARNRTQRLGVSTTIPTGISTTGTAWTGHCFDNYIGTGLSGATGVWINTGSKLAFTNNYSMITRAADASALINPAAA